MPHSGKHFEHDSNVSPTPIFLPLLPFNLSLFAPKPFNSLRQLRLYHISLLTLALLSSVYSPTSGLTCSPLTILLSNTFTKRASTAYLRGLYPDSYYSKFPPAQSEGLLYCGYWKTQLQCKEPNKVRMPKTLR